MFVFVFLAFIPGSSPSAAARTMFKSDVMKSSGEILQDWLVKNSRGSKDLIVADAYDELNSITFTLSGCYRLLLSNSNEYVSFVHDHKKLWNYFTLSPPSSLDGNSFGVHALLFQNAIVYLFETRTILLIKYLTLYHSMIFVLMGIIQPNVLGSVGGNLVMFFLMYAVYAACAKVYKPSIDSDLLTTYNQVEERTEAQAYSSSAVDDSLQYTIHSSEHAFPKIVWYFLSSLMNEIYSFVADPSRDKYIVAVVQGRKLENEELGCDIHTSGKKKNSDKPILGNSVLPSNIGASFSAKRCTKIKINVELEKHADETYECAYYLLLNIGARFLATHSREEAKIRNGTRMTILLILIIIPTMFAYNFLAALAGYTCMLPNDYQQQPWIVGLNCTNQYILVVCTLGTFTMYIQWVTISLAMIVSAVGMLHGSVIMHGLASSWVHRYSGLRQCRLQDDPSMGTQQQQVPLNQRQKQQTMKSKSKRGNNRGDVLYDGVLGETDVRDFDESRESNMEEQGDSPDVHVSDVVSTHHDMSSPCGMIKIDEETSFSKSMMIRSIEIDAYENYLFIQEFVRQVSNIWQGVIIVLCSAGLLTAGYCIGYFLYFLSVGEVSLIFLIPTPLFLWVGLFPVYCLAYANAAIDTIRSSFQKQCTPTNYEIIGGRNQWLEYLGQSPAYWTVFGYAVTWNVLYSLIGSIIGSVLFGIVSIFRV